MRDSRTAMDLNSQPPSAPVFAARARHRDPTSEGYADTGQPPVCLTAPGGFKRIGATGVAVALGGTLCARARTPMTGIPESCPAISRTSASHPLLTRVSYPFPCAQPGHGMSRKRMAAGSGLSALGQRSGLEGTWVRTDPLSKAASLNPARHQIRLDRPVTADARETLIRLPVGLADPSHMQQEV